MSTANPRASGGRPGWLERLASMGRLIGLLTGVAGVSLLLLYFAGTFHTKVHATKNGSPVSLPTDGTFTMVAEVRQPRYESAIGTIKPVHEANVASKILARVLEVNVNAGKHVAVGDVLVRLTDEEQQSRVRQAEAEREALAAQLQLAKSEFARAKQLIGSNAISQADLDTAATRVQTSQSGLDRADRMVEEARVFVTYATIVAPFSGIVVDKSVQPGDTVSPGQVLLSLYDPTHMQLVANVRESLAMRLQVGQKIAASMESLGYECMATVSEVVPKADNTSRSFEVKVTGPCPAGVYSGMFGRLMLPLDEELLLLIPTQSVQRVGQLTYVQVAVDGALSRRSVQLGRRFQDRVEILSGLKAGEQVWMPGSNMERATR